MAADPAWLVRVVLQFSRETEALVSSTPLPPIDLNEFQALWDLPSNDPMVDCIEIGPRQVPFFEHAIGRKFDFTRYSYFASAGTTDWEATKFIGGYLGMYPSPLELPAFPNLTERLPSTSSGVSHS